MQLKKSRDGQPYIDPTVPETPVIRFTFKVKKKRSLLSWVAIVIPILLALFFEYLACFSFFTLLHSQGNLNVLIGSIIFVLWLSLHIGAIYVLIIINRQKRKVFGNN